MLLSSSLQFSSVSQSCPTLCNPMNCSMPRLPVHHQLPEPTQTQVYWVSDATQPSHPLSFPSLPELWFFLMFLIGFIFTPCTVYLQHFLHFFPTVPHVILRPLSHRLWTSYPILDWFLSRSAACPAGILGFPSHGVDVPDSWIPRLSLSWVSFTFLHN